MQETIGEIIRRRKTLTDIQIEQVLLYQRKHGIRFGEAAVALNLATQNDVMSALSAQFDYPHSSFEAGAPTGELISGSNPFGDQAEIFRDLRSQLMMGVMAPDHARCALAVVSPDSGDGRSYVAANLAITFSQLGGNTLLVDADMRSPRLHKLMNVEPSAGLSGMLVGRVNGEVIRTVGGMPSLFLLPAGTVPPNPLELVQRPSFGLLLHELLTRFDHIIVDTPSAAVGSDARVIAAKCGAALVLARRENTAMRAMRKLMTALDKGPAEVAGVVINDH